jgi:hypothetical protein
MHCCPSCPSLIWCNAVHITGYSIESDNACPYVNMHFSPPAPPCSGAMLSSFPNEDLASVAKWLPALQQGMSSKSGLQLLVQQGINKLWSEAWP